MLRLHPIYYDKSVNGGAYERKDHQKKQRHSHM